MITTFSWLSALQAVDCVTLASAARFDDHHGSFDPSRVASEMFGYCGVVGLGPTT